MGNHMNFMMRNKRTLSWKSSVKSNVSIYRRHITRFASLGFVMRDNHAIVIVTRGKQIGAYLNLVSKRLLVNNWNDNSIEL